MKKLSKPLRLTSFAPMLRCIMSRKDCRLSSKVVYTLLLDRALLSLCNGFIDDNGACVIYTVKDLCSATNLCSNTIIDALNQLSDLGLIIRKRTGWDQPSKTHVYIPDEAIEVFAPDACKFSTSAGANIASTDMQKVQPSIRNISIHNNYTYCGCNSNVKLTQEQLDDLAAKYPLSYKQKIDDMSLYIDSTGKQYANHYATLLLWLSKDNASQTNGINYEF